MGETRKLIVPEPKIVTQYLFSKDRKLMLGGEVMKLLERDGVHLELSIRKFNGGGDGDLSRESCEYNLLTGGEVNGPDGRNASVYEVVIDNANGFGRYLSVVMSDCGSLRGFSEKLDEFFDENEFAPKCSYLPQEAVYGFRKFVNWIDRVHYKPGSSSFDRR